MVGLFIKILFFLIPCWLINITLNVFYHLKVKYNLEEKIDRPLDFGYNFFDQQRILGKSTTILGLGVALLSGVIIELFLSNIFLGIFKALGMYFGHALGSFIKRRLKLKSGQFLPFIDHGDGIILTGFIFLALGEINIKIFFFSLILTYISYPILCYLAYKLGLREKPL